MSFWGFVGGFALFSAVWGWFSRLPGRRGKGASQCNGVASAFGNGATRRGYSAAGRGCVAAAQRDGGAVAIGAVAGLGLLGAVGLRRRLDGLRECLAASGVDNDEYAHLSERLEELQNRLDDIEDEADDLDDDLRDDLQDIEDDLQDIEDDLQDIEDDLQEIQDDLQDFEDEFVDEGMEVDEEMEYYQQWDDACFEEGEEDDAW